MQDRANDVLQNAAASLTVDGTADAAIKACSEFFTANAPTPRTLKYGAVIGVVAAAGIYYYYSSSAEPEEMPAPASSNCAAPIACNTIHPDAQDFVDPAVKPAVQVSQSETLFNARKSKLLAFQKNFGEAGFIERPVRFTTGK